MSALYQTLNSKLVTAYFLYGQNEKPDSLFIRPKDDTSKINMDAISFMNTGAGRFANGYQSSVIRAFMSGETPPEYDSNSSFGFAAAKEKFAVNLLK